MFEPPNCDLNVTDTKVPSDAGVAGYGVLLSFVFTAFIALSLCCIIMLQEFKGKPSSICRKLLNSYSDQQILIGIGIQSVGLATSNALRPYHFFIIWALGLLSMSVHNATLLTLVHDFRRDWVLRWMRQFLMFANLVLSCVYGIFLLQAVSKDLTEKTLPIACVWEVESQGTARNVGLSFVGTIVVMAANCIVFALASWYMHSRFLRWGNTIKVVGVLLMICCAIGAAVRVLIASAAFGKGPSFELADNGEKTWGFGQLLSLLVLLFPIVSVIEILRGEIRVPTTDLNEDKLPLVVGTEMQNGQNFRTSFQPNPFFGSQTNAFKK